jgi:hypothetical protein
MPAIAAMDNETLDHLLSVVDDARNLTGIRALSKRGRDHGKGTRAISRRTSYKRVRRLRAQGSLGRRMSGSAMRGRGPATGDQALQTSAAFSAVLASFLVL